MRTGKGLSAQEITAVTQAWQSGALSQDSMMELFRRGEVLPEGRTNEEEAGLVKSDGEKQKAETNPDSEMGMVVGSGVRAKRIAERRPADG